MNIEVDVEQTTSQTSELVPQEKPNQGSRQLLMRKTRANGEEIDEKLPEESWSFHGRIKERKVCRFTQ